MKESPPYSLRRLVALALLGGIVPFGVGAHDIPSKVPKKEQERVNPLAHEAGIIQKGRALYGNLCLSCHGPSGKGDGLASASLGHRLPDLSRVPAGETDGAIFWKIGRGGGAMPSYEKTLTEEERWQIVHYLRTLQEPKKGGGR